MQIPQDIQKIIKEYSMPVYRKSLHYKSICLLNSWSQFESYKYCLLPTPYSCNEVLFDKYSCFEDIKKGSNNNKCMFYLSFSCMFPHSALMNEYEDEIINMEITTQDLELTDVITLN